MLNSLGIEGLYVIHAINGYEKHEKRINELFNSYKFDFKFITEGDQSLLNKEVLKKYFINEDQFHKGALSATLNHILAYEQVVKNNNKYAIIFENDPFFLGDFEKKIERIVFEIEANHLNGFIISLENTCLTFPSYWETKKGQYLYKAVTGRYAGAYMIDLHGAANILDELKHNKCHEIIDWWHNNLIKNGVINMYWAHPPLVEQGSHNGLLTGEISSKGKSYFRIFQWGLQKYYKTYIRRMFKGKSILSTHHII